MAPRKAVKHADTEVLEKIVEAGDVSPPKRKKTAPKAASKGEEEKQIRLPRAAKSVKQIEQVETANVTKKTKPTTKTSTAKNASTKANSNTKPANAKKPKEVEENIENANSPKAKPKEKGKKGVTTDTSEAPTAKKKKQANTEAVMKENNTKAKATRNKAKVDREVEDEVITVTKPTKKVANSKAAKTRVRNTRGRKGALKDDEESKVTEESSSSEAANISDNENNEVQNNQLEETESAQPLKKGKNVKKKVEAAPQKKVSKTRGKTAQRNADNSNGDDTESVKVSKEAQEKTTKENTVTIKKGKGKKGVATKEENGDAREENKTAETVVSNNNTQKFLGESNIKEDDDSDKEDTKLTKKTGTINENDKHTIKEEIDEGDVQSSLVNEEEN